MDKLKILEEIARTGNCSHLTEHNPCSTCPIGNKSINGVVVSVDCWDEVLKDKTSSVIGNEDISEAYKTAAIKILFELLLEEVLDEKGKPELSEADKE